MAREKRVLVVVEAGAWKCENASFGDYVTHHFLLCVMHLTFTELCFGSRLRKGRWKLTGSLLTTVSGTEKSR